MKNEKVLFSGTPCQCAALSAFLNTKKVDRSNLLLVDIVCHGAPNQHIFDRYISEKIDGAKDYEFRFKNKIPYCGKVNSRTASITDVNGKTEILTVHNDPFLKGYYGRLFYRPYCSECCFAKPERVSDITIDDAWHIEDKYKDLNSLEGVSLILINTKKGMECLQDIQIVGSMELRGLDIDWAAKNNAQLREPTIMHPKRSRFFELLENNPFSVAVNISMKSPLYRRILRKVKQKIFGGGDNSEK